MFGKTTEGGDLEFFDETGMLRIRNRIKHANLSFQQRYPILLSTKHDFVNVLLRNLQLKQNHEGV